MRVLDGSALERGHLHALDNKAAALNASNDLADLAIAHGVGLTQNVEELLKSDTARLMLANSEFLILLNQASTDREELAALLNISENQLSYITNVAVGSGLIRCSGNIVPFENTFPKNTDLYKLMTTKPGES